MAEQEQTGKREEARNPQVQKESAAEAIQRDPYHAQAAVEQTAAETGATQEGLESMQDKVGKFAGKAGKFAGQAGTGMHHAVSDTIKTVGSVGDEVIGVARDVLKGAVTATEEVGSGLIGGVQNVAKDALNGVGEIGGAAVHTMTDLLVGIVGGVKTVVGEAMPRRAADASPGGGAIERKRGEAETAGRSGKQERAPEEIMH